jgi:hypothetical protein
VRWKSPKVEDQGTEDYNHGDESRADKRPHQLRSEDSPLQEPKRFKRASSYLSISSVVERLSISSEMGGSDPPFPTDDPETPPKEGSAGTTFPSTGTYNTSFDVGVSDPPHLEEGDDSDYVAKLANIAGPPCPSITIEAPDTFIVPVGQEVFNIPNAFKPRFEGSHIDDDVAKPANVSVAQGPSTTTEASNPPSVLIGQKAFNPPNVFKDPSTFIPATTATQPHPATSKKTGRPAFNRAVHEIAFMVYVPDEADPTKGQYQDISVLGGVGGALKEAFMTACSKNEGTMKRYARMTDPAEADSIIASNRCILNHVVSNLSGGGVYKNGPFRACHQCQFNNSRACVRLYKPNKTDKAVFVVFPKQYPDMSWKNLEFWMGP